MWSSALSKTDKEEKSLIDEVVELKFGKGAKNDPKKEQMIFDFLEDLYCELNIVNGDDDEEEDDDQQHPAFEKEMVSSVGSENRSDGMIPFVVVRKEKTTIDIKCPFCEKEDKIFLSAFKSAQYDEHECIGCGKKSLLKLDFVPQVKTYIEKNRSENQ